MRIDARHVSYLAHLLFQKHVDRSGRLLDVLADKPKGQESFQICSLTSSLTN